MIRIHLTDASFRRIAQAVDAMRDDVIALARRVDSGDIMGDELQIAVGNLAARYDMPEFQVWGLMGEIRAQDREEREVMEELRKERMKPYTFDPDLYTRDSRKADVGGQTHLPSYSNDERNIGDFGADMDQMSDSADGGRKDILADGSIDTTPHEQMRPIGDPTWTTPHEDVYSNPLDENTGFPDLPGRSRHQ